MAAQRNPGRALRYAGGSARGLLIHHHPGRYPQFPIWQEDHGMKLFIGLDVSLAKTAACVLDEHGRIIKEVEVASEPEALAKFAKEQPGEIAAIGLEAGPLSQ